jgi:hypothetical protein
LVDQALHRGGRQGEDGGDLDEQPGRGGLTAAEMGGCRSVTNLKVGGSQSAQKDAFYTRPGGWVWRWEPTWEAAISCAKR